MWRIDAHVPQPRRSTENQRDYWLAQFQKGMGRTSGIGHLQRSTGVPHLPACFKADD